MSSKSVNGKRFGQNRPNTLLALAIEFLYRVIFMDLERLRELLSNEKYPHTHIHKIIGDKTDAFLSGIEEFEDAHPDITRVGEREKDNGRGGAYIALTYEFVATSADEIIELYEATMALPDLKIIL